MSFGGLADVSECRYLSAVAQVIIHSPQGNRMCYLKNCIGCQLKSLRSGLINGDTMSAKKALKLLKEQRPDIMDLEKDQNAVELLEHIISKCSQLRERYGFKQFCQQCDNNHVSDIKVEECKILDLSVDENREKSLQDVINTPIQQDILHESKCKSCDSLKKTRRSTVVDLPSHLIIKLKRDTGQNLHAFRWSPSLTINKVSFSLYGVICHSWSSPPDGRSKVPDTSEVLIDSRWYHFDDKKVELSDLSFKNSYLLFYHQDAKMGADEEKWDIVTFRGDEYPPNIAKKFFERVLEYSRYSHPHIQPSQWNYTEIDDHIKFEGCVAYPKTVTYPELGHEKMEDYLERMGRNVSGDEFDRIVLKFIYQLSLGIDSLHQTEYAKRSCLVLRHICSELLFVETNNGEPTARIRILCAVHIPLPTIKAGDSNPPGVKLPCGHEYRPPHNAVTGDWTDLGEVMDTLLFEMPTLRNEKEKIENGNTDRKILEFIYKQLGSMKNGPTHGDGLKEVRLPYKDAHLYVENLYVKNKEVEKNRETVEVERNRETVEVERNQETVEIQPAEGTRLCHACLRDEIFPELCLRSDKCTAVCCYYCRDCYTVAPLICKQHGPAQSIFGSFALIMYGIKKLSDNQIIKREDTYEQTAKEFTSALSHNRVSNIPYEDMRCGPLYYTKCVQDGKGYQLDMTKSPEKKLDEYGEWLKEKIRKSENPGSVIVWIVYLGHGCEDPKSWAPLGSNKEETLITPKHQKNFLDDIRSTYSESSSASVRFFNCTCFSIAANMLREYEDVNSHAGGEKTSLSAQQLLCQILRGGCENDCQNIRRDSKGYLTVGDVNTYVSIEATRVSLCQKSDNSRTETPYDDIQPCQPKRYRNPMVVNGADSIKLALCSSENAAEFRIHNYDSSNGKKVCRNLYTLDLNIFGEDFDGNTEPKSIKNHHDINKLKSFITGSDKQTQTVLFLMREHLGYSDYSLVMQHDMRPYLQRSTLYYVCENTRQMSLKGFCATCHEGDLCKHHMFNTVALPKTILSMQQFCEFFSDGQCIKWTKLPNPLMFIAYQIFHDYEEVALKIDDEETIENVKTRQAIIDILTGLGMDMDDLKFHLSTESSARKKYSIWQHSMNVLQYKYSEHKYSDHYSQLSYNEKYYILTFTPRDPAPVTESADSGSMSQPPSKVPAGVNVGEGVKESGNRGNVANSGMGDLMSPDGADDNDDGQN